MFRLSVQARPGTTLTMTTQAAERAYRAQPGETGRVETRLSVADTARLNWLPQETILFDGAALSRTLCVDLAPGARALIAEPLVFGRAAMGETLGQASFRDRIRLTRNGRPIFVDATDLGGDITAHLARPFIADGAGAMALVVFAAPEAEAHLSPVRVLLPETAGASLIGDDLLVLRLLAADSHALRQTLIPILTRLRGAPLPRCWMT